MSDNILSLALEQTGVDVLSTLDVSDSVEDPISILNAAAETIDTAVLASDSELTKELLSSLRNKPPVALLPVTAYGTMSILRGDVASPLEGDGFVGSFSPPPSPNIHSTDGSHAKSLPDFDLKDLEDQLHLCQTTKISSPESLPFQSQVSNPNPVTNTAALTTDDELLDLVNTLKNPEYLESFIQSSTYLPDSFPNTTALVTNSSSVPMYDVSAVIDQPQVSRPTQPSFTTTFPGPPPVDRWVEYLPVILEEVIMTFIHVFNPESGQEHRQLQLQQKLVNTNRLASILCLPASRYEVMGKYIDTIIHYLFQVSIYVIIFQLNWMDGPPAKFRKTMPIRSEVKATCNFTNGDN